MSSKRKAARIGGGGGGGGDGLVAVEIIEEPLRSVCQSSPKQQRLGPAFGCDDPSAARKPTDPDSHQAKLASDIVIRDNTGVWARGLHKSVYNSPTNNMIASVAFYAYVNPNIS